MIRPRQPLRSGCSPFGVAKAAGLSVPRDCFIIHKLAIPVPEGGPLGTGRHFDRLCDLGCARDSNRPSAACICGARRSGGLGMCDKRENGRHRRRGPGGAGGERGLDAHGGTQRLARAREDAATAARRQYPLEYSEAGARAEDSSQSGGQSLAAGRPAAPPLRTLHAVG